MMYDCPCGGNLFCKFKTLRWFHNGHVVEWAKDANDIYQGGLFFKFSYWQPNWVWFQWTRPFGNAFSVWVPWLHMHVYRPAKPGRVGGWQTPRPKV